MLIGHLIEKENKNKIRTENDILCYHWGSNLLLKDHFSLYVSHLYLLRLMYLFVDFDSLLSLISMKKVFIQTKNHRQSLRHCLHLMDKIPLSCRINIGWNCFMFFVVFYIYI